MPNVTTYKDAKAGDYLDAIRKYIQENKNINTSAESFTPTYIKSLPNTVNISNTTTATQKGLWFEITNDAGGGTTNAYVAGIISHSVITEYPTAYGQITDTSGWGTGVITQGIIDTTVIIATMSSDGS